MATRIALIVLLATAFSNVLAQTPANGTVDKGSAEAWQAWDAESGEWTDIETFWMRYAKRKGGLTYGPTTQYPKYEEVNELDTLLIQLPQGPCLMEFFHTRWRRANDVRRWDDAFNEYGGCPYVFD